MKQTGECKTERPPEIEIKIAMPPQVQEILTALAQNGYAAYAVGGCVRDALLGVTPHDWDLCTDANPDAIQQVFAGERLCPIGLQHGTVTLVRGGIPYEITTFRVDGAYSDGRRPDSVAFTANLTEDLARRDFTINAMAYRDGVLTDPFGGVRDLMLKKIRCVGNPDKRFAEDALRILRALRFSSVLQFSIAEKSAASIHRNCALLAAVSVERMFAELCRLLTGENAQAVLESYADVILQIIPEVEKSIGFNQKNPHHVFDVWQHTIHAVGASPKDTTVRLALLLHDIGKPDCFSVRGGVGHFYGHAQRSEALTEQILGRLRCAGEMRQNVAQLVRFHDAELVPTQTVALRWLNRLGETQLRRLIAVHRGDAMGQACGAASTKKLEGLARFEAEVQTALQEKRCFSLRDLAVNGADLLAIGVQQGPRIGVLLRRALAEVMQGKLPNEKDALLQFLKQFHSTQSISASNASLHSGFEK